MKLTRNGIIILFFCLFLLASCGQKRQEPVVAPWGEISDTIPEDNDFDLADIQLHGELIALTLIGPETYYDYRGRHLGTQYLLAQRFADKLGVSLRMEVCRDTAEMLSMLEEDAADVICYPLTKEGAGWRFGEAKKNLQKAFRDWYRPSMLAEAQQQQQRLLTAPIVQRRVYAPMLNQAGGVISHYDASFQHHASRIR